MKLNHAKCAFEVSFAEFLEFRVSQRRIEGNQKKIKAIMRIMP